MMGYWTLSDGVMLVKFRGKQFDIFTIQVHAPTTEADFDEMDSFYWGVDKGDFGGVTAASICRQRRLSSRSNVDEY